MSDNICSPGEKIGSIEEYEAGSNSFDDGDMVRSTIIGKTEIDKKERIASVASSKILSFPQVGDVVIGDVAAVLGSMIAVSIQYINGKPMMSHVECICSTRNLRKRTVALVNDTVALKIISHLNGAIHATISEPHLGVLFTKCRKCGGMVMPMRDAIKCKECSWIDDRKLSKDFGNNGFLQLDKK